MLNLKLVPLTTYIPRVKTLSKTLIQAASANRTSGACSDVRRSLLKWSSRTRACSALSEPLMTSAVIGSAAHSVATRPRTASKLSHW